MTQFGQLVLLYIFCMFLEIVNTGALIVTELEMSTEEEGSEEELLNPLTLLKLVFLTILWPAGVIVKLYQIVDFAAIRWGHNDMLEVTTEEDDKKEE